MKINRDDEIRRNIREYLKKNEISIRQLSQRMGCAYSATYKMVNGPSGVTMHSLKKISEALDIDPIIFIVSTSDKGT